MAQPDRDRDTWLFEPDDTVGSTVADAIYRRLIDMILFGELAQGTRLILQELAARFNVSLTPVREALQHLASDGFIETSPRRGYRVKAPTPRQVKELWQVRAALETVAAEGVVDGLTAGRIAPGDLAVLREIQSELDAGGAEMSHRRHMELNARFHQALVRLADNRLLLNLYRGIQIQLLAAWVQRGLDAWRERLPAERAEHHALLDALARQDREAAREAVRAHIDRSLQGAIRDLAQRCDPRDPDTTTKPEIQASGQPSGRMP